MSIICLVSIKLICCSEILKTQQLYYFSPNIQSVFCNDNSVHIVSSFTMTVTFALISPFISPIVTILLNRRCMFFLSTFLFFRTVPSTEQWTGLWGKVLLPRQQIAHAVDIGRHPQILQNLWCQIFQSLFVCSFLPLFKPGFVPA
jgi:hypothetical protein